MKWYARNVGDMLSATRHLSPLEYGCFSLLLDHYYATELPIPANADQVHRICNAHSEQERAAVDLVLVQFFNKGRDGWRNKKADFEIEKSRDISEKRKEAAESRHGANAKQLHTQPQTTTTNNRQHTTKNRGARKLAAVDEIELPPWVSRETWVSYVELRKRKRAPLTERAIVLLMGKLNRWREMGQDPNAVLEQSVMNGWTGVFELKAPGKPGALPDKPKEWWETAPGIEAKGRDLGVPEGDKGFQDFKWRVFVAAGDGPWNQRERDHAIAKQTLERAAAG